MTSLIEALLIMNTEHIPIATDFDEENPDTYGVVLIEESPNPECEAIKHDLYTRLSAEAKDVLRIIWNAPMEACTPLTGNITKRSLTLYAKKVLGGPKASKALGEVKRFVREAY